MKEPMLSRKSTKLLGRELPSSVSGDQIRDAISGKQALQLFDNAVAGDVTELLHLDKSAENVGSDQIVVGIMMTDVRRLYATKACLALVSGSAAPSYEQMREPDKTDRTPSTLRSKFISDHHTELLARSLHLAMLNCPSSCSLHEVSGTACSVELLAVTYIHEQTIGCDQVVSYPVQLV